MNRRRFLQTSALGAGALLVPGLSGCAESRRRKPNVIYILADDLGYAELGCYGQEIIQTPNLDRMAAEGIRFTQHYSGSPVCAPSRCVLLTGKHTGHSYIRDNGRAPGRPLDPTKGLFPGQNPIPDEEFTLAEVLKERGYATACIGKWGLGYKGSTGDPNRQGFDLFFGYYCQIHAHNHYPRFLWRNGEKVALEGNDGGLTGKHYSADLFTEEAKRFIRENQNRPFFLYLAYTLPHVSIQVPEETLALYKGKLPETPYKARGHYLRHPYPHAGYAAMVTHLDMRIGEILQVLKELELDENTLVMFSSDNGPTYDRVGGADSAFFHSTGPLRGRKASVYEGGIRIPFIARWPGVIEPGRVTDHVSALWDVFPTVCEVAGVPIPRGLDGVSFLPTLAGRGEQPKHEALYWEFRSYGGQQALRFGDWKAVRTGLRRPGTDTRIQLYNLTEDVGESRNVASERPDLVARAKELMLASRTKSKLFPFPEIYEREW